MTEDPDEDSLSDEVKQEDGLERYWFVYKGEWAQTIVGLITAIGGVFWCSSIF